MPRKQVKRTVHGIPTKTLTLNGVDFTTTAATAVRLPADSTIVLNGVKTIKGDCYGIYVEVAWSSLTISCSGTLNVTGGMVISGALFGDKMSPISDSTNLAPVGAGTDLFSHIHAMTKTTAPTYLITLVFFIIMGLKVGDVAVDMATIDAITSDLAANFHINVITLIPIIIMVTLSVMKFHPLVAMYSGVLAGAIVAIFLQGVSVAEIFSYLNFGFSIDGVNEMIAPILNRGGLQSMMWTFSLAMIVISLAGVLQGVGYLNVIVEVITSKIHKPAPMNYRCNCNCNVHHRSYRRFLFRHSPYRYIICRRL